MILKGDINYENNKTSNLAQNFYLYLVLSVVSHLRLRHKTIIQQQSETHGSYWIPMELKDAHILLKNVEDEGLIGLRILTETSWYRCC